MHVVLSETRTNVLARIDSRALGPDDDHWEEG